MKSNVVLVIEGTEVKGSTLGILFFLQRETVLAQMHRITMHFFTLHLFNVLYLKNKFHKFTT